MVHWWYAKKDERRGPITVEQLRVLLNSGGVLATDLAWTQGMEQWQPVSSIAEIVGPTLNPISPQSAARLSKVSQVSNPQSGQESCPHCGASNSLETVFCESCGKALPGPIPKTPRIITTELLPSSGAARKLISDELTKQTRSAATALLVVAIIQLVVAGLAAAFVFNVPRRAAAAINVPLLLSSLLGVGFIFLGLYFWARRSPLPATIVGLVVYGTLMVLNVVTSVAAMARSSGQTRGSGFGGIGIGWLDIVIVAILCRGIMAALKQRKISALGVA